MATRRHRAGRTPLSRARNSKTGAPTATETIQTLPQPVATAVLAFLRAPDVCSAARTCKALRDAAADAWLWRVFCKAAGLLKDESDGDDGRGNGAGGAAGGVDGVGYKRRYRDWFVAREAKRVGGVRKVVGQQTARLGPRRGPRVSEKLGLSFDVRVGGVRWVLQRASPFSGKPRLSTRTRASGARGGARRGGRGGRASGGAGGKAGDKRDAPGAAPVLPVAFDKTTRSLSSVWFTVRPPRGASPVKRAALTDIEVTAHSRALGRRRVVLHTRVDDAQWRGAATVRDSDVWLHTLVESLPAASDSRAPTGLLLNVGGGCAFVTSFGGDDVGVIIVCLPHEELLGRLLAGTPQHVPTLDDLSRGYGTHGFSVCCTLRTHERVLWEDSFRDVEAATPWVSLASRRVVGLWLQQPRTDAVAMSERTLQGAATTRWKTTTLTGGCEGGVVMEVAVLDENSEAAWTSTRFVRLLDRSDASRYPAFPAGSAAAGFDIDFDHSDAERFAAVMDGPPGRIVVELAEVPSGDSDDEYKASEERVGLAARFSEKQTLIVRAAWMELTDTWVDAWFGTSYSSRRK